MKPQRLKQRKSLILKGGEYMSVGWRLSLHNYIIAPIYWMITNIVEH
jgi:hypothetical protein